METKEQYLLEAKNLSKYFPVKNFFGKLVQEVRAVDRVNLSIKKGETFGLVGESGCGKSVTSLSIMGLLGRGGSVIDGSVLFDGKELLTMSDKELRFFYICEILFWSFLVWWSYSCS